MILEEIAMVSEGKRVTQRDIVDALMSDGVRVSGNTVSKALRNERGVSSSIHDKVHEMAKKLGGYKAKDEEQRGQRRRAGRIGVITPTIGAVHYQELAHELVRHAAPEGYAVFLQPTDDNPIVEVRAAKLFRDFRVDFFFDWSDAPPSPEIVAE